MSQYLFLFTIGPVQSFIAQARKTQDLYAGSYLLSYLTDIAIDRLHQLTDSCDLIFPNKQIKSKPNRFISKIECIDPEIIGSELCLFVQNRYKSICDAIRESLNLRAPKGFDQQVSNFLDIHWIAVDFKEEDYGTKFGELESYLGAVKNIRCFSQFDESGRKCSLCGERNVLFYGGKNKRAYVQNDAERITNTSSIFIDDGEGLCGVCLSKRFAKEYFKRSYKRNYPSTAEMALMDTISKLDSSLLSEYKNTFGNDFNEQLYYKDNLTKPYFEKYGIQVSHESSVDNLTPILNLAEKKGLKFSNYYAVLCLDGDNMGKWLSGKFLDDKSKLMDFHVRLTDKLGLYADHVTNTIDEPRGKVVYSGGDDVLALINLNHLLSVMKEIRDSFPKFEEITNVTNEKKSSASCGICIAHYKTPLQEVITWARKMEHEAKSIDANKDAFAIAVLKRSGEIHKTVFKWKYDTLNTIDVLIELISLLKPSSSSDVPSFSDSFVKKLQEEFSLLMDDDGIYSEDNAIFKTEVKRLMNRSCMMSKKEGESKNEFASRKEQTVINITNKLAILAEKSKSLENFLSLLNTATFIEREVNSCS